MSYKIFGGFLILIGIAVLGTVAYKNSHKSQAPIVYSPTLMLSALWNTYKESYWESSTGRTVDKQRGNITTSEGQSYTMLRAVWQDDKPVFDKSWEWTQKNLSRPNDNLFAWLYGQTQNGSYGILTNEGGQNAASDADSDIALALVFASVRWQNPDYLNAAKKIISDIWDKEVVTVKGVPYLAADDLEKQPKATAVINPSYFSPYAYRIFATLDKTHNWNALVDSSYSVLQQSMAEKLDKTGSTNLPPDWILLNVNTGSLVGSSSGNLSTNYSYDALRIPWRIALDYKWNGDQRAKQTLENLGFLNAQWQQHGALYSSYSHDGQKLSDLEAPAMYGGSIGYFLITDPNEAKNVYEQKLQDLYNPDIESWKKPMSYYDDNWSWFGIALYNNKLIDLFQPSSQQQTTLQP